VEELREGCDRGVGGGMVDKGRDAGRTMPGIPRRAFLPEIAANTSGPVRRLDMRFACERQMIDFGVRYTLHSDAGVRLTPIDRFVQGLRAAVIELRLTPQEALLAATRTAAEALQLDHGGTLTPGKRADLVVGKGNPLEDLACLEDVQAVMKAGEWVSLPLAA